MFEEMPQEVLILAGGTFVLGWIVAKIGAWISGRFSAAPRDPRDDRIRSLEAEQRVANAKAEKTQEELEEATSEVADLQREIAERDSQIELQQQSILELRADLKESVKKTRELRSELQHRATENVRSEVKLREVETELAVSRASTDLIATGVLDYTEIPEEDDDDQSGRAEAAT